MIVFDFLIYFMCVCVSFISNSVIVSGVRVCERPHIQGYPAKMCCCYTVHDVSFIDIVLTNVSI